MKKVLKNRCLKQFKSLGFGQKIKISHCIVKNLETIISQRKAKNILIYLSLPFEVGLQKFISKNRKKLNLFVPLMQTISSLKWYHIGYR